MTEEQLKWNVGNGLVKKVLMPLDFYDAWNAAEKVPFNGRAYQPGADFAFVDGKQAREILSGMFQNKAREIRNLSASQAKRACYTIRSVYFG